MRSWLLPLFTLAAALLTASTARAQVETRHRPMVRRHVTVHLEDEAGRQLRTFHQHGQTYVLGLQGQRYNVRLQSQSSRRVEAVISIDGRDALTGQPADLVSRRGYVLPPHGSVVVRGFRTSLRTVAAFRFTNPPDSYAGRLGTPQRLGIIEVAVYPERRVDPVVIVPHPRPIPRPRPFPRRGGTPFDSHPGSKSAGAAEAPSAGAPDFDARRHVHVMPRPQSNNLGTQFGETRISRVVQIHFERQNRHQASQRLVLRYDDAEGLLARGIAVYPPPPRPVPVLPVWVPAEPPPPRFAEPPPPYPWEW